MNFGEDAGGGDREAGRVALDDGLLGAWPVNGVAAVDEQVVGAEGELVTARRMASSEAWRMLMRSMVSASTAAMAQATALARICMSNSLRFFSVSFLESVRPSRWQPLGRMTAAATTGPKRGPRPTSSRPAMRRAPRRRAARSSFHPHTGGWP